MKPMPDRDAPVMFERTLPKVIPFKIEWVPESFRGWITDIAERMQCPVDYFVATFMVELGTVIGRRIQMCPKRHDD